MSTLKVNSIEPANAGSEDYFLARAWVNFNGSGTVAIRADGNVSSITDNGTGDYTVNFSTASADANHATTLTAGDTGSNYLRTCKFAVGSAYTSSSVALDTVNTTNSYYDSDRIMAQVTR